MTVWSARDFTFLYQMIEGYLTDTAAIQSLLPSAEDGLLAGLFDRNSYARAGDRLTQCCTRKTHKNFEDRVRCAIDGCAVSLCVIAQPIRFCNDPHSIKTVSPQIFAADSRSPALADIFVAFFVWFSGYRRSSLRLSVSSRSKAPTDIRWPLTRPSICRILAIRSSPQLSLLRGICISPRIDSFRAPSVSGCRCVDPGRPWTPSPCVFATAGIPRWVRSSLRFLVAGFVERCSRLHENSARD